MMWSGIGGKGKALKACDVGEEIRDEDADEDADDVGESIIVVGVGLLCPDVADLSCKES